MSLVNYKRRAEAIKMEGEAFQKVDLRSMKAFGSTFTNCWFTGCDLDLTDWRASKFEDCHFFNCSMRLVNLATSFFDGCMFVDCDLEQASFMGSQFRDVEFRNCRMAYGETLFQDATAKAKLVLEDCNLHGSSLDFREVEPGALVFTRSNLWNAKMSMGCAIWNGSFDERLVKQFLALVARVSGDPEIVALAGDQYPVVCRAMDGRKVCRDSTTSQETTSTLTPAFPEAMDTIATATTILTPTTTTRSRQ